MSREALNFFYVLKLKKKKKVLEVPGLFQLRRGDTSGKIIISYLTHKTISFAQHLAKYISLADISSGSAGLNNVLFIV